MTDYVASESNIVSSGNVYDLLVGDTLVVDQGVSIATSQDGSYAVRGQGSNDVTLNGAAIATTSIYLDEESTLTIGERGFASGTYTGVIAYDSVIDNAGTIFGNQYGLLIYDGSTVTNTGLISAGPSGFPAVEASGADDDVFKIANSGEITAQDDGEAYLSDYDSIDSIWNTGTITGDIRLGGGNDTYGGKSGLVNGTVYGDDGNDFLGGGTEANRLSGGEGLDSLYGRGGNDTFIFDTAPNKQTNLDHIGDFANARGNNDRFELQQSVFDALQVGKLDASEFANIKSSQTVVGSDDHILYKQSNGTVFYDADGGSAANRVAIAVLDNEAKLTSADFFVV